MGQEEAIQRATERHVFHASGYELERHGAAWSFLLRWLRQHPGVRDAALYTYSREMLRGIKAPRVTIGETMADELLSGRQPVLWRRGPRLRLQTRAKHDSEAEAAFVMFGADPLLELADPGRRLGSPRIVVAVPWNVVQMRGWIAEHRPTEHGEARVISEGTAG